MIHGRAAERGGHPSTSDAVVNQPPHLAAYERRHREARNWRASVTAFVLRIDVLWPALFFLFLSCLAAIVIVISVSQLPKPALAAWQSIHSWHVQHTKDLLNIEIEKAHRIATTLMAASLQDPLPMHSENTLSIVCSTFAAFDTNVKLRAVALISAAQQEAVTCIHTVDSDGRPSALTGTISNNSIIEATYLVNTSTYTFERPLVVVSKWAEKDQNISSSIEAALSTSDGFQQSRLFYEGLRDSVDLRTLWIYFPRMPHLFYYNIPMTFVARGFNASETRHLDDFAGVRIDGSQLLPLVTAGKTSEHRVVMFVNQSLNTRDPLIFATNYGQKAVSNYSIYSATADDPVTYLKSSDVSDDLLCAGLRHVDFPAMQTAGYEFSKTFSYRGASAVVTAYTFVTDRGLILPIVSVSGQIEITPPFLRIMNICGGVAHLTVLLFTALFWWFVHTSFSVPLQRVAALMRHSATTGRRVLFRNARGASGVRLREVEALVTAHDDTMRCLRDIDKYVPPELRDARTGGGYTLKDGTARRAEQAHATAANGTTDAAALDSRSMLQQQLTVVSIIVVSPPKHSKPGLPTSVPAESAPANGEQGGRGRLAAVVNSAAQAAAHVNSGPFDSSASLTLFLCKVEELCDVYGGVVHRLAPDVCVAHFGGATRAHLLRTHQTAAAAAESATGECELATMDASQQSEDAALEACVAADAQAGMTFSIAVQEWVAAVRQADSPIVTVMVDTSLFTYGHYKPRGSEQTLSVAFGRNVKRKLGHVPAKIGVSVAMTEETARLVRAGAGGTAFPGVRQLPVESLHVGRPGLNADVVILFEALPGPVLACEAWQAYSRCCFSAFGCMVRGDYASALRHYRAVADVADLEPGLMPRCFRREAVRRSSVVGGAVSTQVERLMAECERRVRTGSTARFCRDRCDPLGIDAVLQSVWSLSAAPAPPQPRRLSAESAQAEQRRLRAARDALLTSWNPGIGVRRAIDLPLRVGSLRTVLATPPGWMRDNVGMFWRIAARSITFTPSAMWASRFVGLGSAGALATLNYLAFREVPAHVATALRGLPAGELSEAACSTVPVFAPSPLQKATLRALLKKEATLRHTNLLAPISYTLVVEGGAALVWEFCTGATLRQVIARYARIKPVTLSLFAYGILAGLVHLHNRGVAHGSLHMDNVIVGADGVCRLQGHSASLKRYRRLFVVPRSRYVSPAMAAGALPTPACDVFCYGLMCIEMLTKARAWRWADDVAEQDIEEEGIESCPTTQQQQQPTDDRSVEALDALMEDAAQPFEDAVRDGLLVPNLDALDTAVLVREYGEEGPVLLRACLSRDPGARPSALELLKATREVLLAAGLAMTEIAD